MTGSHQRGTYVLGYSPHTLHEIALRVNFLQHNANNNK